MEFSLPLASFLNSVIPPFQSLCFSPWLPGLGFPLIDSDLVLVLIPHCFKQFKTVEGVLSNIFAISVVDIFWLTYSSCIKSRSRITLDFPLKDLLDELSSPALFLGYLGAPNSLRMCSTPLLLYPVMSAVFLMLLTSRYVSATYPPIRFGLDDISHPQTPSSRLRIPCDDAPCEALPFSYETQTQRRFLTPCN